MKGLIGAVLEKEKKDGQKQEECRLQRGLTDELDPIISKSDRDTADAEEP